MSFRCSPVQWSFGVSKKSSQTVWHLWVYTRKFAAGVSRNDFYIRQIYCMNFQPINTNDKSLNRRAKNFLSWSWTCCKGVQSVLDMNIILMKWDCRETLHVRHSSAKNDGKLILTPWYRNRVKAFAELDGGESVIFWPTTVICLMNEPLFWSDPGRLRVRWKRITFRCWNVATD